MGDLKLIQDKITGKIHIKENSQYNNVDADYVTVHSNITARVYGNVKDIALNEGSKLFLHGVITGSVINMGGEIHIFK